MTFISPLSTPRLTLRSLEERDAHFVLGLLNDAAFIRFIGDRNVRSIEDAHAYIADGPIKSYETHGFGLLLINRNEDDEPIGLCGLLKRDYLSEPDIGFALLPAFTGAGYAYEAARAVIDDAIARLHLKRILAIVQSDNVASRALLTKLGFTHNGTVQAPDVRDDLLLYALATNAHEKAS